MKSKFILFIAIIAIIGFSTTACGDGDGSDGDPGNGNGDPNGLSLGDTITSTTTGMVLTWIPAGTFTMGSSDISDATPHQVTLTQGFYMGKTEVTQEQWRSVMGNDARLAQVNSGTNYGRGDNFPMYYVSWYDAILFCNRLSIEDNLTPTYHVEGISNWLTATAPDGTNTNWDNAQIVAGSTGYRLPTEAQWEYACRASTITAYNTGTTITTGQANYSSSSTTAVRNYSPNAWGLYDMHGNVWDWYLVYPTGGSPRTDPIITAALGSVPVNRGGSWSDTVGWLRSARRNLTNPDGPANVCGFRVVRP